MSTDFKLKSLAALAPNKMVSLSFEALNPGIDFSTQAIEVLDGIFFQQNPVSSKLQICHLAEPPS